MQLCITNLLYSTVANEIPNVNSLVKRQIITEKLVKLKTDLTLIMIMINILLIKDLMN